MILAAAALQALYGPMDCPAGTFDVIIIAGQSNAAEGALATSLPHGMWFSHPVEQTTWGGLMDCSGTFRAQAPVAPVNGGFGVELPIAVTAGCPTLITKFVVNGSRLWGWLPCEFSPVPFCLEQCYSQMFEEHVQDAMTEAEVNPQSLFYGLQPNVRGFVWVQGAADVNLWGGSARDYEENLKVLRAWVAHFAYATDIRMAVTRLHPGTSGTYVQEVRAEQELFSRTEPNVRLVSIDDGQLDTDMIHHDDSTIWLNGIRLGTSLWGPN